MIYVLGDSFSWGYNFFLKNNPNRKKLIYPYYLGEKLNSEVKNLSVPGSSNWRIARILMNLPLHEDDIVIIGWSEPSRLEIPVKKSSLLPSEIVLTADTLNSFESNLHDNPNFAMSSFIEKDMDKSYLTRRVSPIHMYKLDQIKNKKFKSFIESYYMDFYDVNYACDMFLVMFSACVYKLRSSKCNFRMFNTFGVPTLQDNDIVNIPEFFLGYKKTMLDVLRPVKSKLYKSLGGHDTTYFSIDEHKQIADMLYNSLQEDL